MEVRITPYEKAQPIEWNFEEIKTELVEKIETYKHLQYTPDQIASAKTDRAALRNLSKALDEERKRREREFMEPFGLFKAQVNELITLIDEPVKIIDAQVKEYEEAEKRAKREACIKVFNDTENVPDWLRFEQIENPKWQNKTTSEKTIAEEIAERVAKINSDIALISELPEYSFEAMESYKRTLDAASAIAEGKRLADIQRRKEEAAQAEKERQERMAQAAAEKAQISIPDAEVIETIPVIEKAEEKANTPQKMVVRFECELDVEQALALREFFKAKNISYRQI